jgi:hypothetical protein
MLNSISLDSFIKELQQINYDYFVWAKANGRLEVGSGFEPPNVLMDDGNGTLVPAKIQFDPEVGVIIR